MWVPIRSMVHDLVKGIKDWKQMDIFLLDFAKAFDKEPHLRLIQKIDHYGIRGSCNLWIKVSSGTESRRFSSMGNFLRQWQSILEFHKAWYWAPHILFLMFINDLPEYVQSSSVRLFESDCLLYRSIDIDGNAQLPQTDLGELHNWESTWLMEFHPSKFQLLRVKNHGSVVIHTSCTIHRQMVKHAGWFWLNT